MNPSPTTKNAHLVSRLHQWLKTRRRRRRLQQLLKRSSSKIVLGAAHKQMPGWIGTDIYELNILKRDDWERYFAENSIEALLAEHVWEHLTIEQGRAAAALCFQFLQPGGYLRIAVPDGLHPDPAYIEWVRPGGSGPGADDHKLLYTYKTFAALFVDAGFEVILLEHFDETGQFHSLDWSADDGMIDRSRHFDQRNDAQNLNYTSIILDVVKPNMPVKKSRPTSRSKAA
jgi:predicted SAM-dependent methyltransferase